MRISGRTRLWVAGVLATIVITGPVWADSTSCTSAPASQPADERILVRIGETAVVTQAEFEKNMLRLQPEIRARHASDIVAGLVEKKLLLLYLEKHPDLATLKEVKAEVEENMKTGPIKTYQELEKSLREKGATLEDYYEGRILNLAQRKLRREGAERGQDEALLAKMFKAHPDHWDGSRVTVRHILIHFPVYATPKEIEAKRAQAQRIRDDLLSGRRTWSECVQESDCNTRLRDGLIGPMPRHGRLTEAVISAAWGLEVGQTSEVVRSHLGFHVIQILKRTGGFRDLDDIKTRIAMQAYLEKELLREAIVGTRERHLVVGVQPPDMTGLLPETRPASATRPATRPTSRPAD